MEPPEQFKGFSPEFAKHEPDLALISKPADSIITANGTDIGLQPPVKTSTLSPDCSPREQSAHSADKSQG
jgi:hypothetical protein